jgi:hypothetical protein
MKFRVFIANWLIERAISILPDKRTSNYKTTWFKHYKKTTGYKIILIAEGGER